MRIAVKIYIVFTLSIFMLTSCNNSETNQIAEKELEFQKKELELKQKELALKQKELELKEKDLSKQETKETINPGTTTDNTNSKSSYNYTGHSNFQTFWADFKKAVLATDKDAIVLMTNFPFLDGEILVNGKSNELKCNTPSEFVKYYDKIINSKCIEAVKRNDYRGFRQPDQDDFEDIINNGDYLLNVKYSEARRKDLVFSKFGGKYKLKWIQYYP